MEISPIGKLLWPLPRRRAGLIQPAKATEPNAELPTPVTVTTEFSAGALVDAEQADVFERGLPDGDNAIGERGLSAAQWDVEHNRPNLFGIEERHKGDRIGIGRLVVPVEWPQGYAVEAAFLP
jgi:hypothetical protein